jgi:hypothetical protein
MGGLSYKSKNKAQQSYLLGSFLLSFWAIKLDLKSRTKAPLRDRFTLSSNCPFFSIVIKLRQINHEFYRHPPPRDL